ncbi:hypothetical protein [Streptomyces yanii]|uniref:Uncharacterized protein n=1 Tax=Streptomyces yanii TaxID=78510 RepID=A0ABV5R5R5_9ACTN
MYQAILSTPSVTSTVLRREHAERFVADQRHRARTPGRLPFRKFTNDEWISMSYDGAFLWGPANFSGRPPPG